MERYTLLTHIQVADATLKLEKPAEEPWQENLNMQMICPHCKENPPNLVEEFAAGDMVCGSCGTVLGDRIVDTRSEWRTFSNDDQNNDDPSRVGDAANPLLVGGQLQTSIAYGDGGSRARDLHRAQNKSTHDKTNKTLLNAYKEIGALCDGWQISKNVSDTAKHLFKMTNEAGAFKGKQQEVVIAGCIFIACRQCQLPRTFREVFALTKVSKKEIGRIFKALEKFFASENLEKEKNLVKAGGKFWLAGAVLRISGADVVICSCRQSQRHLQHYHLDQSSRAMQSILQPAWTQSKNDHDFAVTCRQDVHSRRSCRPFPTIRSSGLHLFRFTSDGFS